jgi:electron transfer flavoprotein beta subunit
MKIVVAYKWAANPQDAEVSPDGAVDWGRATEGISEYDPVAVEVGRQLADATGAELVGVTVGAASAAAPLARKAALSRGLDRLVIAADVALAGLDTTATAQALAQIIKDLGDVCLVLAGDVSIDVAAKLVPATLAGSLGWPCLLEVSSVKLDGSTVTAERASAAGVEVVQVTTPAVIACSADATVPRIPGMKDILAAAKKPSEAVSLALSSPPRTVEVIERRRPALKARKGDLLNGEDAESAAAALYQRLHDGGVL